MWRERQIKLRMLETLYQEMQKVEVLLDRPNDMKVLNAAKAINTTTVSTPPARVPFSVVYKPLLLHKASRLRHIPLNKRDTEGTQIKICFLASFTQY